VAPEFRQFIEGLLQTLRTEDLEVFAAIEHEGWMLSSNVPPEVGVQKDIAELDAADVLVALVDDKPSAGVQFELGYAVAKEKQAVLAHTAGATLAYFNQGLVSAGLVTIVSYDQPDALAAQLTVAINAPAE
jgi:nucleoside 2-deoxyribosyltransferase